jgi:hypothetical protein
MLTRGSFDPRALHSSLSPVWVPHQRRASTSRPTWGMCTGPPEPSGVRIAGQQRQRAHLRHRLASRVGVHGAHAGCSGVQSDQQVEALLLAYLAHHDPLWPHPQGLADEMSQTDLARALRAGLPRLHPHHIRQRDAQHIAAASTHLDRRSRRDDSTAGRDLDGMDGAPP